MFFKEIFNFFVKMASYKDFLLIIGQMRQFCHKIIAICGLNVSTPNKTHK